MVFTSIGFNYDTFNIINTKYYGPSYPFNIIFSSLQMVKHCLETDFSYYTDKQYLEEVGENTRHTFYQSYIQTEMMNRYFNTGSADPAIFPYLIKNPDNLKYDSNNFMDLYKGRVQDKTMCMVYEINFFTKEENDYSDIISFASYVKEQSPLTQIVVLKFIQDPLRRDTELYLHSDNLYIYYIYCEKWEKIYTGKPLYNALECLKNHA